MSGGEEGETEPPRAGLGLWLGAMSYLLVQLVVAVVGGAWGVMDDNVLVYLSLLLLSGVWILIVGYAPELLKETFLEKILLATGVPLLGVAAIQAWVEPFVLVQVAEWPTGYSFAYRLNWQLPAILNLMLFLAALGHVARLGSRWHRWLLLDAPLLATSVVVLRIYLGDRPEFQG
jgi:hypothetical protein